jgi:signal transduction histidine kinase
MGRTRTLFNVGYALVLAVVVASGLVSYHNLATIEASNRGVEHTREVLVELRRLQSTYNDAETNQRTYLLTGRDASLKPFRDAATELADVMARLATLTSDNPAQRGRIAELDRLKSSILEDLHRGVALRDAGDLQAAQDIAHTDRSRRNRARADTLLAEMVGEEERLLKERTERSAIAHRRTIASSAVATGTAILLLAVVFSLKRHEDMERERAAEALRLARDAAEEANRAKDQFLAVLSHELRTPLNPVLLATTAMLDHPPSPEDVRPTLEMIRRNVELEARLIDDLLDVMRIVRGKMPFQWGVADCHDLIRRAVEICRGDIRDEDLRVTLDLSAAHHHAHADAARLQQVLWNLVQNAVKFTPPGGSIAIRTRDEGDRLAIEVADTGIGIEPEVLPHIFDPFRQGETSVLRRFGGLGLGLAISRGIVEAHGGRLVVESRGTDLGSTFRVELAALPQPEAGTGGGEEDGASETVPSLKVLVVEDEPQTLRLLARLVRGLGHEVTTAETLQAACEAERDGDHDLIISDIGLPDGSGLDLMRQVVARRGKLPAIALTGYGTEEDVQKSKEAGFAEHMTKPIDFARLKDVIGRVTA